MFVNRISPWETWDPFREINQLQEEMNRNYPSFRNRRSASAYPRFNVWEGADGLVITTELPGLTVDDIDISVEGDVLTLKGEKHLPEMDEKHSFVRKERDFGKFSRTVRLPYRIDPNGVSAKFNNGVLTLKLNRPEEEKPKKIQVNVE